MTRRLLLLSGLAIFAVVLNHAAGFGQIALFLWTDTYLPVSVPYWAPLGTLADWALVAIRSIGVFAVPAFLFASGFFSAYLARGGELSTRHWRAVFKRVLGLAIPYLVWSAIIFAGEALQGVVYRPLDYVSKLFSTGASGYLYFVPLLCTCYLLSPWIVVGAKRHPRLLLLVPIALLLGSYLVHAQVRSGAAGPALEWMARVTPAWSLSWWLVYFVLGVVVALDSGSVVRMLARYRWLSLGLAVPLWVLNVIEGHYLLATTRTRWFAGSDTVTGVVSALSTLACVLAFADAEMPGAGALKELGSRSYGIYLMHMLIIESVARAIRKAAPGILAYQAVIVPALLAVGIGAPLLLMGAADRWPPARRVRRYVFG